MEEYWVSICRGCLATNVKLFNLFDSGLAEDYGELITEEILPSDGMPTTICSFCLGLLRKATAFRNQCRAAGDYLRLILSSQIRLTENTVTALHKSINKTNITRTSMQILSYDRKQQHASLSANEKDTKAPVAEYDLTLDDSDSDESKSYVKDESLHTDNDNIKKENKFNSTSTKNEIAFIKVESFNTNFIQQNETKISTKPEKTNGVDLNVSPLKDNMSNIETIFHCSDDFSIKSNDNEGNKFKWDNNYLTIDIESDHDAMTVSETDNTQSTKISQKSKSKKNRSSNVRKGLNSTKMVLSFVKQYRKYNTKEEYLAKINKEKVEFYLRQYDTEIFKLSKEEVLRELEEKRNRAEFKKANYKCEMCVKILRQERAYKQHMATHDKSRGDFECDICRKRFPDRRKLQGHKLGHHLYTYRCMVCCKTFKSGPAAANHGLTHRNAKIVCSTCGKIFKRKSCLSQHKRLMHGAARCPICDARCVSETTMKKHIQITHNLPCEFCGAIYQTMDALIEHQSYEGDPCYTERRPCSECDEVFPSMEALEAHFCTPLQPKVPAVKKPAVKESSAKGCYECDRCQRKFTLKHFLINHIMRYDGKFCPSQCWTAEKHKRKTQSKRYYDKIYTCEVCGFNVDKFATLREHQRLHTGEKPYKCEVCHKAFRIKTGLKIHMTLHTGERGYICSICGKRFRQNAHLIAHFTGMHSSEKPFKCRFCDKRFSYSASRWEHENAHQGIVRMQKRGKVYWIRKPEKES